VVVRAAVVVPVAVVGRAEVAEVERGAVRLRRHPNR